MAWLVACQYLLYAMGWGLCGAWLREHRSAVLHWGGFMLLLGLGFVLTTLRSEPRSFWPYAGANICFVASFIALRRGLEVFLGQAPRDREHAVMLAAALVGFGVLGPGLDTAHWRVVGSYGGIALVLARTVATSFAPLVQEYGRATALATSAPALLVALPFAARTLQQLLDLGTPLEMHFIGRVNVGVFFAYLVAGTLFNLTFITLLTLRLVRRLRHLSQHDALTGLLNRRALMDALEREWQRLRRHGQPFAVLMLDLDHFKRVNDSLGHAAGDLVLTEAARRLAASARASDVVARAGGEEFMVLLPGADTKGATRAAERLLARLREQPVDLPARSLPVTASAGVALALASDTGVAAVLARADAALYRAKEAGRDRVVLA